MVKVPPITPEGYALLDAISNSESKGDWNVIYGGQRFSDFSAHPRQYVTIKSGPNAGKKSSAAGKYQITASTYDRVAPKLGITDFSPQSQQKIAWYLANQDYGPGLPDALATGDAKTLKSVAKRLSSTWTSLPSGIEAGTTGNKFVTHYTAALNHPVPPMNIPSVGTELSVTPSALTGRAAQGVNFGAAGAPLPKPEPLSSPGSLYDKMPKDASYGVQQRLASGQKTAIPTDFQKLMPLGSPADARTMALGQPFSPPFQSDSHPLSNAVPASIAPVPFPSNPGVAPIAPVPMPGRPAALDVPAASPRTPQQAVPAPQASVAPSTPAAKPVKLPSGKMIAPGVYPSNDGNHNVQITDDGSGNAKITHLTNLKEIPGLIDPMREIDKPTVAGGIIRAMVPSALSAFSTSSPNAIGTVQSKALGAANSIVGGVDKVPGVPEMAGYIGGQINNAKDSLTNFLGFGKSKDQGPISAPLGSTFTNQVSSRAGTPLGTPFVSEDHPTSNRVVPFVPPVRSNAVITRAPTPMPGRPASLSSNATTPVLKNPAPVASSSSGSSGSGGASPSGVQTFAGSATGRQYTVGQTYSNKDGSFVAQSNGTFKKVA